MDTQVLSVSLPEACALLSPSVPAFEPMWKKAQRLMSTPGCVTTAAGLDSNHCMVASEDSKAHPHLVTKQPGGRVTCDSNCPMWKARWVFSHTIAGADYMSCLKDFLQWFQRSKPAVNLTALATHGAKQAGSKPSQRKGGKKKKKPLSKK